MPNIFCWHGRQIYFAEEEKPLEGENLCDCEEEEDFMFGDDRRHQKTASQCIYRIVNGTVICIRMIYPDIYSDENNSCYYS